MILHPLDNVEVRDDGHKYAIRAIASGGNVVKYGMPIGHATADIAPGEHVHTHNLRTNLSGRLHYTYTPDFVRTATACDRTFMGFVRPDGQVGVRNDLWVIPTVACVNRPAERLAASVGGLALTHPYGCSQLGGDHETTVRLLAALAHHPNAGGVLVLGLGCENNTLAGFKAALGDYSRLNIRFLVAQEVTDELSAGRELLAELAQNRVAVRSCVPVSELKVGLKCGGSDGFSGLTANPLLGRFSDWLTAQGGTSVLTEVPEMFGAETLLMNRCADRTVFDACVRLINDFKAYYERHGQVIYENPSPGNKAGGITTLEEKSLGCVQKGGHGVVTDVLEYGERLRKSGLTLLSGPGNDPVAATALAAAGCQLVLFSTGRGTPYATVVPTVKVATNSDLAARKPGWIDYDAMNAPGVEAFTEYLLRVASGTATVCGERNQAAEIAIFKTGVTL